MNSLSSISLAKIFEGSDWNLYFWVTSAFPSMRPYKEIDPCRQLGGGQWLPTKEGLSNDFEQSPKDCSRVTKITNLNIRHISIYTAKYVHSYKQLLGTHAESHCLIPFSYSYLWHPSPFIPIKVMLVVKQQQKQNRKRHKWYNQRLPYHSYIAYTVRKILKINKDLVCD